MSFGLASLYLFKTKLKDCMLSKVYDEHFMLDIEKKLGRYIFFYIW